VKGLALSETDNRIPLASPAVFISADWSKDPRKRSVHVADLGQRRIWRPEDGRWDLGTVLELARCLARRGPVLVGLDLVLGVPSGYWAQVREHPPWHGVESPVGWLRLLDPSSDFFATVKEPAAWRVDRPFFHVPAGKGGLGSFQGRVQGGLLRRVDQLVGAKPMFAVSGIPGTVGSGTRDLWMELIPRLKDDRDFAVWPFEGELQTLLATRRIVLAETYPGLAYAAAVAGGLPTHRLIVSKTQGPARELACDLLKRAPWVQEAGVDLGDLAPARADEDAFDSHLTAVAVLRCAIEGLPLCDPSWIDEKDEGAILLAGPVDPARPAKRLEERTSGKSAAATSTQGRLDLLQPSRRSRSRRPRTEPGAGRERRDYPCPVP